MVNPYESPQLPEEPLPEDPGPIAPDNPFTLQFEFGPAQQHKSAVSFRGRQAMWSGAAVWAHIVVGFFVGRWFGEFAYQFPLGDDNFVQLVWGVLFVFGLLGTWLSLTLLVNRCLGWRTLRRLRSHPVLSGLGQWKVTIGEAEIAVETPLGQQTWPLAQAAYLETSQRGILWLEPQLPIVLPMAMDSAHWLDRRGRDALRGRVEMIRWYE